MTTMDALFLDRRQRRALARAGTRGRRGAIRVFPRRWQKSPVRALAVHYEIRRVMARDFADAVNRLGPIAMPDGARFEFVEPTQVERSSR